MTRSALDASTAAAAAGTSLYGAQLFKLAFPSVTLYLTDFGEPIAFSGNTYLPDAKLLDWSGYQENTDQHPREISLALGISADVLAAVTGDNFQNALVNVWIATLSSARVLIGTPYAVATNLRMSTATVQLGDGTGQITLSCETREVYGERDSAQLCTSASQLLRYAGDTILSDLTVTANKVVEWGGKLQPAASGPPTFRGGVIKRYLA